MNKTGKTQIPNLLTAVRIALAICLLFIPPLSAGFYVIYIICGLTDILDGYIARKYRAETETGARLDSAADFVLAAALAIRLYPVISPPAAAIYWTVLIALIRFTSAIAAKLRFGRLGFLHTYGNKLTGLLLFLYPMSLMFSQSVIVIYLLLAISTLSAFEELAIGLSAKRWDSNRKTIFQTR